MAHPSGPTRFRCKVGGEWKSLSDFSNAQQRLIRHGNVDPAHSGMTCRQHTAGSRMELKCELCLLTKPIDEFSKNSRRNKEYQCRRCVAWIEIQEPTLTPGPLETGHISPEEENIQMLRQRFRTSADFADCDVDDENLLPRAPITGLASLGLDEEAVTKALGKDTIDAFLSNLPPHLRSKAASVASFSANVSETSSVQNDGASLPHYQRTRYNALSSVSSTTEEMSLPITLREANPDVESTSHRSYNAWGPGGDMERRKITTSVTDDSMSATASTMSIQNADPNIVGDWSKVTGPRVEPQRRSRWGKDIRMSPAELRERMGDVHQTYMHRETDSQKRINPIRCDLDDDDSD
ncbi:hypothetical protein NLG97_g7407 [Lecanicillium saksenae]|uniref:Uncharacterized protein n=1 Tax=Lecanicillium saksenae TaxID=468837 RepID=A0ACC1QNQ6_9HYPO|nr:hypothetical protein NLG97_g7407 [Lecanicillium saksenae]